jgi:hypothetical protein
MDDVYTCCTVPCWQRALSISGAPDAILSLLTLIGLGITNTVNTPFGIFRTQYAITSTNSLDSHLGARPDRSSVSRIPSNLYPGQRG